MKRWELVIVFFFKQMSKNPKSIPDIKKKKCWWFSIYIEFYVIQKAHL